MKQRNPRLWQVAIATIMLLGATNLVHAQETQKKPLKVFILAGQSNMEERVKWRKLVGLGDSPVTKTLYDKLVDKDGNIKPATF